MKATDLLKQQHRNVEAIFDHMEKAGGSAKLLDRLANDLAGHMAIEQNIFYPAVREYSEDLVAESFEEHAIAEVALKRLLRVGASHVTFEAKLATLRELIENHVEEEERELFPAVEDALGDEELEKLGAQMARAFQSAMSEGFSALVPQGMSHTSADDARNALSEAAHDGRGSHAHR